MNVKIGVNSQAASKNLPPSPSVNLTWTNLTISPSWGYVYKLETKYISEEKKPVGHKN